MSPQRFREIESLYQAALVCAPAERLTLLEAAEPELRREVESLLAQNGTLRELSTETETQPAPGAQLGPYRIECSLGAGGMGEVFRATDTRLGRSVAVKIAHERFSERFHREARALSALNHPHICTLYDVGPNYLVMELVEGETLAARLKRGKLSMEDTVRYGAQIADALAAAHACGIIHRDLKPANVMLTKSGVKVLDFGLAKSAQDETLTASRVVMGTPAYMAPEQREGKECDPRTDIFALGLVLCEMATGKRPALDGAPPLDRLPERLVHVLGRCLAPISEDRWQSARDVQLELQWVRGQGLSLPAAGRRPMPASRTAIAVIVLLGVLLAGILYSRRAGPSDFPQLRLAIVPPRGVDLVGEVAVAPDGSAVVFVAHSAGANRLWIRRLDTAEARELPGTEGAALPFWSPDSRFAGFFANGKLKRIDVRSGVPTVVCDVGLGRGGTWNQEGVIIFNSVNDGPLLRVAASGGTPAALTVVDQSRTENSHRFPHFLPDGHRFLYYIRAENPDVQGVYLGSLDRPREKIRLTKAGTAAMFVPGRKSASGYLAWVENGTLMLRPFDSRNGRFEGEAEPAGEQVSWNGAGRYADFSVSAAGTLVYTPVAVKLMQLTWFGRDGRPLGLLGPPDSYLAARLSPDGKRIAVTRAASPSHSGGVALLEIARGIATPLAQPNVFMGPWSPDGGRIAYSWSTSGAPNVYAITTSGEGRPERLTESGNSQMALDWSGNGRYMLYSEQPNDLRETAQAGLWVLPLEDRKPFFFAPAGSDNITNNGTFSPETQWIAYASRESGRLEIYLRSFPSGKAKSQVSSNGGSHPRWRKDGRELFYLAPDRTVMSVPVRRGAETPELGSPTPLFKIAVPAAPDSSYPYDVAPDGQRILGLVPAGDAEPQTLAVIANWR